MKFRIANCKEQEQKVVLELKPDGGGLSQTPVVYANDVPIAKFLPNGTIFLPVANAEEKKAMGFRLNSDGEVVTV